MGEKQKTTWHGGGIYSKARTDRKGEPHEAFFVRAWIPSEKRMRVFKAGRSLASAERLRRRILGDPDKAVEDRQRKSQEKGKAVTVAKLCGMFTSRYRGRGGTGYYTSILRPVVKALGRMRVADLTPQTFDGYLKRRRAERTRGKYVYVEGKRTLIKAGERRVSESTLRKEIIASAKMLKWARQRSLTAADPLKDYERPQEPKGAAAKALSYEEEDRLLSALPPLERDVVAWAIDSGMRRGEIAALEWGRIDRPNGLVYVEDTKNDRIRSFPLSLSDRLGEILDRHPQRISTGLLFHNREGAALDLTTMDAILIGAFKAAKIKREKGELWNKLRKTCVSRLYTAGALPQQEADWLGHSMAVAMKHYRELSPAARAGAEGLLNRPASVANTVARKTEIA